MSERVALPWTNPPLTGNRTRGNPYARAKEVGEAKAAAQYAIRDAGVRHFDRATVEIHMRTKNWHRRDADGLAPTLKVCLDALVLEGVLPDDSFKHVPAVTLAIHPPNGEPASLWLVIEEAA